MQQNNKTLSGSDRFSSAMFATAFQFSLFSFRAIFLNPTSSSYSSVSQLVFRFRFSTPLSFPTVFVGDLGFFQLLGFSDDVSRALARHLHVVGDRRSAFKDGDEESVRAGRVGTEPDASLGARREGVAVTWRECSGLQRGVVEAVPAGFDELEEGGDGDGTGGGWTTTEARRKDILDDTLVLTNVY